jgi:hypothetical protein
MLSLPNISGKEKEKEKIRKAKVSGELIPLGETTWSRSFKTINRSGWGIRLNSVDLGTYMKFFSKWAGHRIANRKFSLAVVFHQSNNISGKEKEKEKIRKAKVSGELIPLGETSHGPLRPASRPTPTTIRASSAGFGRSSGDLC